MPQAATSGEQSPIRAEGLGKRYPRVGPRGSLRRLLGRGSEAGPWALRGIDLRVDRGETLGVIGLNGSGKSTLLGLLAGVTPPTAGSVRTPPRTGALLDLGVGFHPEFTGRENAAFALKIRGVERKRAATLLGDIERFADIGGAFDEPMRSYSTGMFMRVAFATAICDEPEAMLVDEALAVGDARFQQKCFDRLRHGMAGAAKVIVSHDLRVVSEMCDRVLVLDAGEAVFEGEPKAAVEAYLARLHLTATGTETGSETDAGSGREVELSPGREPAWIDIDASQRTGDGLVRITGVAATDPEGAPVRAVRGGERIRLHVRFESERDEAALLFGYLVLDRLGVELTGQNTADAPVRLAAGEHRVSFDMVWPPLKGGAYTVTLGIGRGSEAIGHGVACWAPSAIEIESVQEGVVHGLFAGSLDGFELGSGGGVVR